MLLLENNQVWERMKWVYHSFHSLHISLFRKFLLKCRSSYRWHGDKKSTLCTISMQNLLIHLCNDKTGVIRDYFFINPEKFHCPFNHCISATVIRIHYCYSYKLLHSYTVLVTKPDLKGPNTKILSSYSWFLYSICYLLLCMGQRLYLKVSHDGIFHVLQG